MDFNTTIFLIDDDAVYRYGMQKILRAQLSDVNIIPFNNGLEALEYLGNETREIAYPDLILVDINMPIMNGWEFLNELDKLEININKETSLYVVSNFSEIALKEICKSFTFIKGYLKKPIDLRVSQYGIPGLSIAV
ncbi:response regulator [Leeuwenhoekiella sp. NPDC079379]|uniref:response regulator n=1 Tax=Leeuwenhoekiella sp. NPDC079379 TaxID=3364122 RepID=UPI0037CA25F5